MSISSNSKLSLSHKSSRFSTFGSALGVTVPKHKHLYKLKHEIQIKLGFSSCAGNVSYNNKNMRYDIH